MKTRHFCVALASTLVLACGGGGTSSEDMAVAADLTSGNPDQATSDLATPDLAAAGDMATPDMLSPLVLSNPPSCGVAVVTADQLYTNVFKANCTQNGAGCHATGSGGVTITSGATLRLSWIDKVLEGARVPVVKSGGGDAAVNGSYIMYKLLNQAAVAGGNNTSSMPKGGAKLADADLCQFINWIKNGAS